MTFFCLGDLMVDVVARLFGPLAEGSDSPAVISYVGGGSADQLSYLRRRVLLPHLPIVARERRRLRATAKRGSRGG